MRLALTTIPFALLAAACAAPATSAAPVKTVVVTAPPSSVSPSSVSPSSVSPSSVSPSSVSPGSAPASAAAKPPVKRPAAAPVKKVAVPKVVGMNHQAAQDLLQSKGFYALAEKDATGQERLLLWDRNWVVVRQNPPAGTKADPAKTTVTLSSKKIGE